MIKVTIETENSKQVLQGDFAYGGVCDGDEVQDGNLFVVGSASKYTPLRILIGLVNLLEKTSMNEPVYISVLLTAEKWVTEELKKLKIKKRKGAVQNIDKNDKIIKEILDLIDQL